MREDILHSYAFNLTYAKMLTADVTDEQMCQDIIDTEKKPHGGVRIRYFSQHSKGVHSYPVPAGKTGILADKILKGYGYPFPAV